MSIKVQLAELCANRKLPMDEFKQLPAFSMMEKENDIIEKIERFRLPEITKLICGSELLSSTPWADKYTKIKPLYCASGEIDAEKTILGYQTVSTFESEILCFADADILSAFRSYYDNLNALLESKRRERTSLTRKINAKKKKDVEDSSETTDPVPINENSIPSEEDMPTDAINEQSVEPSAEEKKLEVLKSELSKLDKYLKQSKSYIEKIHAYEAKVQENDSDENREKAYRSLNDVKMPLEEAFLRSFISSGVVSEEYHAQFRNPSFMSRVLQCLDKGSFKDYTLPILLKLYDEGAVDLVEGPASDFLDQHPERLCEYLVDKTPDSIEELECAELELLIEKAIQKELRNAEKNATPLFAPFWNTISNEDIWKWIVSKVNEIVNGEDINAAISCMLLKLEGKAAKSLVEVLFGTPDFEVKVSTTEVTSALLKSSGSSERDVIIETLRLLEQNNRKIQRKLNTAERKLRSHSQELFSSVYLPMEQLEELAINLKMTKGEIKASLVASHLIDLVLALREGFETLDLHPIVDPDDWKYQNKIEFDTSTHRVTADGDSPPDVVRLRSLGFRYQDDDGEWQQYGAQASVEIDPPVAEKQPRKGYPKYEQPGKVKNKGSGHRTSHPKSQNSKKVKAHRKG